MIVQFAPMHPVPCTLGDGGQRDATVHGHISLGGASVMLEIENGSDGYALAARRKVVIGIDEFSTCRFRKGILADRLHLRTSSMFALGGVPGAFEDAIVLCFNKRDRAAAQALAGELREKLDETSISI